MEIDKTKPVFTVEGVPASFFCDDGHSLYPLSFQLPGKMVSVTRTGQYKIGSKSKYDLTNFLPSYQLDLFIAGEAT